MACNENLKSFNTMSPEQAKEIHSKGGKASSKARRKKKAMKKQLELLLAMPLTNEKAKSRISELGIEDKDIDNQMAITIALFQEALKGNTKAYEIIRDTIGEKPIERQEIKEIKTEWFK